VPWDFLVTGWRRSGTTMFASMLEQHPAVTCDNDSFNYFYSGEAYFRFLQNPGAARAEEGGMVRGIKVLDPFLVPQWKYRRLLAFSRSRYGTDANVPSFADYSRLIENFTQIVSASQPLVLEVVRHPVHVYVSEQIALQRREFRYRSPYDPRYGHVFDIDAFRRWFRIKREIDARVEFLKEGRYLAIAYGDLVDPYRRAEVMQRVFAMLGVEAQVPKPTTSKQLPNALSAYVVNFEEAIAMLQSSELAHLAEGVERGL
jgi:hypothetical protein